MRPGQAWAWLLWPVGLAALVVGGCAAVAGQLGLWVLLADVIRTLQTLSAVAPVATACLYALAYAAMVAICLPGMAGGVLLGVWLGTAVATSSWPPAPPSAPRWDADAVSCWNAFARNWSATALPPCWLCASCQ
jgi:hypothetical protein